MAPEPLKAYRDQQAEVEKALQYRYRDKERERSNRAAGLNELARGTRRRCPMLHSDIAWSGPPHDKVRAYVCLYCNAAACEPEIKDMGYDFNTVGIEAIHAILDADLQRQAEQGNPSFFVGLGGMLSGHQA